MSAEVDDEPAVATPGYHYFHDKVASGEGAAPAPQPQKLAVEAVEGAAPVIPPKTIDTFSFMDDDDVVKVYVALEGDLAAVTDADISATFHKPPYNDTCSMNVVIKGEKHSYQLAAEKLFGVIVVDECKCKINKKKQKLIVTLKKAGRKEPWEQLRAKNCLPYRRGGGG